MFKTNKTEVYIIKMSKIEKNLFFQHLAEKSTKNLSNRNRVLSQNESDGKHFANKLKEFYERWKGNAHEKTQSTPNIINKSDPIYLGDLAHIQTAQVMKIKTKRRETIPAKSLNLVCKLL